MSKNDEKVRALLTEINVKRTELGEKPKATWTSNGLIRLEGFTEVNLNVLNSLEKCVAITSRVLKEKEAIEKASDFLELPPVSVGHLDDYLKDLKLKASQLKWEEENKKLKKLEEKLKELRSEDARVEDALSDIMAQLK